jgi:hypothetical protein
MHQWRTPRRDKLHSNALPDSAYRSLVAGPGPGPGCSVSLVGLYCETGVFAGNARRMQFARGAGWAVEKDTPKVKYPSGLVAFGRALGRIGRFSAGVLMWLAEGGYTMGVGYYCLASWSARRLKVNYTWTTWIHVSCTALQPWCSHAGHSQSATGKRRTWL